MLPKLKTKLTVCLYFNASRIDSVIMPWSHAQSSCGTACIVDQERGEAKVEDRLGRRFRLWFGVFLGGDGYKE